MLRTLKFAACFVVLLLFGFSSTARAQDTATQQSSTQAESQNGAHHMQHQSRLEYMSKELNLTDDQKAKIKPVLEDEMSKMKSVRDDTSLSQDQKRDKMKDIRENTDSQITGVLTPDQQKKYEDMKAREKAQHQQKTQQPQPQS